VDDYDGPTWHQDVAPLIAAHCIHCHSEGNIGPFVFGEYDQAKVLAQWIANNIRQRNMPPWPAEASDRCTPPHPFQHDIRLTDEEIDTIVEWGRRDAHEGDPETAAPLPPPIDRELDDATHRMDRGSAWSIGDADDGYFCFVLDPEFEEPQWLTAAQVVPDALDLLHHVVLYSVPPELAEATRDRLGPDDSFECFSTLAEDEFEPLFVWLPDTPPLRFPADTGVRADPGSLLLMQVHYHAWADTGGLDQTAVDMRWTSDPPAREARFEVVGTNRESAVLDDPPFVIPPERNQHVEEVRFEVPAEWGDSLLWSVSGRLNYAGSGLEVTLDSASGDDDACLLSIPKWNLDWMRLYLYDAPVEDLPSVRPGDEIALWCEFDNTWANEQLRGVIQEAGLDATIEMDADSEGELSEMCVAILGLLDDTP